MPRFLEKNTDLIYTPFLLNHHLHFQSIISKLPLDTSLISDFVYLTKSSKSWYIVLVELEHPNKKLFNENSKLITPTKDFTAAISQIHSWKDFILQNGNEIIRRLEPIRKPLQRNKCFFKYLLVIGRSDQISNNQALKNRLISLEDPDFRICTYDTLIENMEFGRPEKKNILRLTKDFYEFKYIHLEPFNMFSSLSPEDIHLTTAQKTMLISKGYEIDKWERGEHLLVNGKRTAKSFFRKKSCH